MSPSDNYIGLHAAEKAYGVSVATLRKRIARGDLKLYLDRLDDRRKLLKVAELEALLTPTPVHATPTGSVAVSR